jgi:glycosyltransferase involved in cell wall biosynthesis
VNAPNAMLPQPPVAPDPPGRAAADAPDGLLRIGIDARAAVEVPAGRGRVVRELLRALCARREGAERYLLYARARWTEAPELAGDERFLWRTIAAGEPWWHVRAAHAANRECDVFLACNSYLTPRFLRVPCVPIVHDLVTFDRTMRPNRRSRVIEQLTFGPAVRRAGALIVTTQVTADALLERRPDAAGRVVVAPLGVAPALAGGAGAEDAASGRAAADGLGEVGVGAVGDGAGADAAAANAAAPSGAALPAPGFVLAAGTLEPRKNLPRLVEAYRRLPEGLRARHPLVVVGALGWETGETLAAVDSLGEQGIRLGYVSDAALAELYRRCAVFCYPSLGEGFGLPVLEAMAAGAAVLTSKVSSLPEVGGEAVAYADPHDTQSIADALAGVLADEEMRAELGERARARAALFSWERFAQTVLDTLAAAAGGAVHSGGAAARGGPDGAAPGGPDGAGRVPTGSGSAL